jgi:Lrp/AsnC family transcriptional regulator, leucine-responsive regulatory protein
MRKGGSDRLDKINVRILEELQGDGRLSNVELASRVHLSPSPCLARVKDLENSGVISRYVAILDPLTVGLSVSVFIHITLEQQSEKYLEIFEAAIRNFPEVMECYLMTGDSDYMLRVLVPDVQSLEQFIVQDLSKIKGVSNIRSSFALKQVKYKTAIPLQS